MRNSAVQPHRADRRFRFLGRSETDVHPAWRAVDTWHREVMETRAIRPPDANRDVGAELARLGPPFTDYVAHHRPYFERLLAEVTAGPDHQLSLIHI